MTMICSINGLSGQEFRNSVARRVVLCCFRDKLPPTYVVLDGKRASPASFDVPKPVSQTCGTLESRKLHRAKVSFCLDLAQLLPWP